MDNQQLHTHKHFFAWGIVALVSVIAIFATIGLVLFYYPPAAPAGVVYYYPFWGARLFFGLFFVFALFWFLRWAFWGWGWRYRRAYWGGGYGYWRHRDGSYYILRERYAKGEITKEQYDQMMRDSTNTRQHRPCILPGQRTAVAPIFLSLTLIFPAIHLPLPHFT